MRRIICLFLMPFSLNLYGSDLLQLFVEKEAKRFKLKVGVFLVLEEKGKVLLLRRYNTGISDGKYVVPMGGHDGHETLTTALIREAKEEINIDLTPNDVTVCHVMHRFHLMPDGLSFEQVDVFYNVMHYEGCIKNNEPDKCDELLFCSADQLPDMMDPFIRHALYCIRNGIFYSEFGFENVN